MPARADCFRSQNPATNCNPARTERFRSESKKFPGIAEPGRFTLDSGLEVELKKFAPALLDVDFETLISYTYQDHPWKEVKERHSELSLYDQVLHVLRNCLNREEDDYMSRLGRDSLDPVLRKFFQHVADRRATLVSLNYDTLVENILTEYEETKGGGVVKPFANAAGTLTDLYQLPILDLVCRWGGGFIGGHDLLKDGIRLIKLHGSTNWFATGDIAEPNLTIYFAKEQYRKDFDAARVVGLDPVIIPPAFDKAQFYTSHNILRSLWRQARLAIEKATGIVIIGYSLPISDSYIRLLFRVTTRPDFSIKVVNPAIANPGFQESIRDYFDWVDSRNFLFYSSLAEYIDTL